MGGPAITRPDLSAGYVHTCVTFCDGQCHCEPVTRVVYAALTATLGTPTFRQYQRAVTAAYAALGATADVPDPSPASGTDSDLPAPS